MTDFSSSINTSDNTQNHSQSNSHDHSQAPTDGETLAKPTTFKGSVADLKGLFSGKISEGLASVASTVASRIERKADEAARSNVGTSKLAISSISPCPNQPRQVFEPKALEELAQTMRELGQAQAITVRKITNGYEIISGERRFRAAKLAGFTHLDCVIKDCTEKEARLLALVENMQREDLLPIEEAFYLKKILEENPEMTLEKLAQRLGSHKSTLSEKIKLTEVPEDLHGLLHSRGRSFTHRHWRVVSRIPELNFRRTMLVQALENGLSVAELERSLKAAGINRGAKRISQRGQSQMDLPVSGMGGDFRIFSRSGGAIRLHGATLIPSELNDEQKNHLGKQLDMLRQELLGI